VLLLDRTYKQAQMAPFFTHRPAGFFYSNRGNHYGWGRREGGCVEGFFVGGKMRRNGRCFLRPLNLRKSHKD